MMLTSSPRTLEQCKNLLRTCLQMACLYIFTFYCAHFYCDTIYGCKVKGSICDIQNKFIEVMCVLKEASVWYVWELLQWASAERTEGPWGTTPRASSTAQTRLSKYPLFTALTEGVALQHYITTAFYTAYHFCMHDFSQGMHSTTLQPGYSWWQKL